MHTHTLTYIHAHAHSHFRTHHIHTYKLIHTHTHDRGLWVDTHSTTPDTNIASPSTQTAPLLTHTYCQCDTHHR